MPFHGIRQSSTLCGVTIGESSNGRTTVFGAVYWGSNPCSPAKMLIKIWKTIVFLVVLSVSIILSGYITYIIGDKIFNAFPAGCPREMICIGLTKPISISEYPYNILFGIFVSLSLIFTLLLTLVSLKFIFNNVKK